MTKKYLVLLLLALSAFFLFADRTAITSDGKKVLLKDDGTWQFTKEETGESGNFNFRKTFWGMTKDQVKNVEASSPIREDAKFLLYKGNINNLDCVYGFIFANGQLVRSKYIITQGHTNKNDYIIDYSSLKAAIAAKYGAPIKDETIWKNSLYKDKEEEWGFAISLGHLSYYSYWKTETTEILLGLQGDIYKMDFVVEYSSISLAGLEKQEMQEDL